MPIRLLFCFLMAAPALCAQSLVFDSMLWLRQEQVLFDFGKHELRLGADSLLRNLGKEYLEQTRVFLHVCAHTDAIGSNENNRKLSQRRAEVVAAVLLETGIPQTRIQINDYGEERPVADNTTEAERQANRRATLDFYLQKQFFYVEGQIKDSVTNQGIQAEIVVKTKSYQDSMQTDTAGRFRVMLPNQEVVVIDAFAKGYLFETQVFKAEAGKTKLLSIAVPPATAGASAEIKNLYFVGNQAVLLPRSEPELYKALRFCQLNPDLTLEIEGHINRPNEKPVAESSWDFDLSVRRAKLVYEYLIENGIPANRLTYKGYGNFRMRFPKATTALQQELNRRVEIRILKTD
ncbi:MAG: OmpA family protein [Saprospiraceae bacterium]|nr:OmpA family protein [Saprospiraceae bacterium]